MSGSAGARGYLLQAIITLLDALQDDSGWISLTLEPNSVSEKVDIVWYYSGPTVKVTQVKSSQNQIGIKQVKAWASDIEESIHADIYELVLIGPCSQSVVEAKQIGQVMIPTPQVLNTGGLIEQAAHRLDVYIEKKGIPRVSALTREMFVNALVTKLETYSTTGTPISRQKLDNLIEDWIRATRSAQAGGVDITTSGIPYRDWIDALVSYQVSNNPLAAGIVAWLTEIQSALKVINAGIGRFAQGGYISNAEIWQYYVGAERVEEVLEGISVPPTGLQVHLELRESARHYRKAIGNLHQDDQRAFSDELAAAGKRTMEATRLLADIVSKLSANQ